MEESSDKTIFADHETEEIISAPRGQNEKNQVYFGVYCGRYWTFGYPYSESI
jgi:hypothetical protein